MKRTPILCLSGDSAVPSSLWTGLYRARQEIRAGVHWYWQWVIDVQHLRQQENDPALLELTQVKEYMVPAFAVEHALVQWSPPNRMGSSLNETIALLRDHLSEGVANQVWFVYSNPNFNVSAQTLTGRAYATYPGEDGFMVLASLFEPDDLTVFVPTSAIVAIHLDERGKNYPNA